MPYHVISSINSVIMLLADCSIKQARLAASGPHIYNNINVLLFIFVEQALNAMSRVQSGTFAVLYKLWNARLEDMQIQAMVDKFNKSSLLQMMDLHPSILAIQLYLTQMAVNQLDRKGNRGNQSQYSDWRYWRKHLSIYTNYVFHLEQVWRDRKWRL